MKRKIIGKCPICDSKLYIKSLSCDNCNTEINGEFDLSPFNYLTKEQETFALIFLKNAGNIKLIEKELGISYPTVKKNIDDLLNALGLENNNKFNFNNKKEVLEALRKGEISFIEAEKYLGGE